MGTTVMSRAAATRTGNTVSTKRDPAAIALALSIVEFALVPDSGIPNTYYFATYAFAAAACIFALTRQGLALRPNGTTWLVAAFYFLLTCMSLGAEDANAAVRSAATGVVGVLFVLTTSYLTRAGRSLVDRWLIALAVFETGLALLQKLRGGPIVWGYLGTTPEAVHGFNPIWSPLTGRSLGTLSHPIPLALVIGVGLVLAFSTPGLRAVVRVPIAAVLLAGMIATGTRSAVVSVVIVVLLMALIQVRGRYRWFGRALLTATLIVFLIRANIRDLSVFTSLDGTISLSNRVGAVGVFTELFNGTPLHLLLGQGRSGTSYLAAQEGLASTVVSVIDNNFVTVTVMTGLVGLAITLALCIRPFRNPQATNVYALAFMIAMFLSFDVFLWQIAMALFLYFAATPRPDPTPGLR